MRKTGMLNKIKNRILINFLLCCALFAVTLAIVGCGGLIVEPEPITFEVIFIANDGNENIYWEIQIIEYGEMVQQPDAPTREGYEFAYWTSDEAGYYRFDFTRASYGRHQFIRSMEFGRFGFGSCSGASSRSVGWRVKWYVVSLVA